MLQKRRAHKANILSLHLPPYCSMSLLESVACCRRRLIAPLLSLRILIVVFASAGRDLQHSNSSCQKSKHVRDNSLGCRTFAHHHSFAESPEHISQKYEIMLAFSSTSRRTKNTTLQAGCRRFVLFPYHIHSSDKVAVCADTMRSLFLDYIGVPARVSCSTSAKLRAVSARSSLCSTVMKSARLTGRGLRPSRTRYTSHSS